jgi:hypothetical protein
MLFKILTKESFISFSDLKFIFQKYFNFLLSLFNFIRCSFTFNSFSDNVLSLIKTFLAIFIFIASIFSDIFIHSFE